MKITLSPKPKSKLMLSYGAEDGIQCLELARKGSTTELWPQLELHLHAIVCNYTHTIIQDLLHALS